MKYKLISTHSVLTAITSAALVTIPLVLNTTKTVTNNNQTQTEDIATNGIIHSSNVQIVNSIDQIVLEDFRISNGTSSSAIVNYNGKQDIYVWGRNDLGQLGLGDNVDRLVPTLLPVATLGNYTNIIQLRIGYSSSSIIVQTSTGQRVYVWGDNAYGQLGLGNKQRQLAPVLFDTTQFGEFESIKKLTFGESSFKFSTAILKTKTAQDKIYVWGYNDYANLGLNDKNTRTIPTVLDLSEYVEFDAIKEINFLGDHRTYAWLNTKDGDKILVWGRNDYGQLGLGHKNLVIKPTIFTFAKISGASIKAFNYNNFSANMVLTRNGIDEIYVWGHNQYGQLGLGNTTDQVLPILLPASSFGGYSTIVDLQIANSSFACVQRNGATLIYVWGQNTYGQLGLNSVTNQNTPQRFNPTAISDFNYNDIIFTSLSSNAFKANAFINDSNTQNSNFIYLKTATGDKLYTWGYNEFGQLGNGNTNNQSVLVNISTFDLNASKIKAIYFSDSRILNIILDTNGKLENYASGYNIYGQLGNNTTTNVNTLTNILPLIETKPKALETKSSMAASDIHDQINPNKTLNKTELAKYVDLSSFPTDSILSVNDTTVNYQQGIIDFKIKTNKYNSLLVKNAITKDNVYSVSVTGFKPVNDISKYPVVVKSNISDSLTISQIFTKTVTNNIVTDRVLLGQYFDLSSIPDTAQLSLQRTTFNSDYNANFTLQSNQVYDNNGRTINRQYIVDLTLIVPIANLALILGLSISGGILLLGVIIAGIITNKKRKEHLCSKYSI